MKRLNAFMSARYNCCTVTALHTATPCFLLVMTYHSNHYQHLLPAVLTRPAQQTSTGKETLLMGKTCTVGFKTLRS